MIMVIEPKVQITSKYAKLPEYATDGSGGMDLKPAIEKEIVIQPGKTEMVPLGLRIWIENPFVAGFLLPRSGLGTKHGLVLANTIGLIDPDYQGEWIVAIYNRSDVAFRLKTDERIAQAIFVPIVKVTDFNVVDRFSSETVRGEGGFGSTGR